MMPNLSANIDFEDFICFLVFLKGNGLYCQISKLSKYNKVKEHFQQKYYELASKIKHIPV